MSDESNIFLRISLCVLGYTMCLLLVSVTLLREWDVGLGLVGVITFLASWRQENVIRRLINMQEVKKWSMDNWDE